MRVFETRYQVYCVEKRFLSPDKFPHRCEIDEYDPRSIHSVLNLRSTGDTIGTVRLVLPDSNKEPSFSLNRILDLHPDTPLPVAHTAEVSRFGIAKGLRATENGADGSGAAPQKSSAPAIMSLGLMQGLVRMSTMHNITHWCALMEPQLIRMFGAMGINLTAVGGLLEHRGLRQLCYCEIKTALAEVLDKRPGFWEIMTDKGQLFPVYA